MTNAMSIIHMTLFVANIYALKTVTPLKVNSRYLFVVGLTLLHLWFVGQLSMKYVISLCHYLLGHGFARMVEIILVLVLLGLVYFVGQFIYILLCGPYVSETRYRMLVATTLQRLRSILFIQA